MAVGYDIVICTTAVSRSKLHKDIFPKYLNFIQGLRCKWYINIDQIQEELSTVTEAELISILDSPLIDLDIRTNNTGGTRESFYKSAQYLVKVAKKTSPKFGYFWLEDDWLFYGKTTLIEYLNQINFNSKDYLQLVERNKELSFNPSLYGKELFTEIIKKGLSKRYSPDNANPERACTYPPNLSIKAVESYYKLACFRDVGREWTRKKGVWRTFQKTEKRI